MSVTRLEGRRQEAARPAPAQVGILEHLANVATSFVPASELLFRETCKTHDFVCYGGLVGASEHELLVALEMLHQILARSMSGCVEPRELRVSH